ncbi:hypothetical protein L873DRAFT_1405076 [Choiromyces venosus 120613-1]|uniref:Uncharacterized protein n=1 Tax=Choiromyces venosus 120613-1 TaxID=1336337 RepID=A0A3N4J936_9PEZI|nr:hypothetical protein L873DRAFT_1405076 [Choiromyces venosus 120613-1]
MLEYVPWKKKAKQPATAAAVPTHNETVGKPTTTATTAADITTTATPQSPKPVLSHRDEEFLEKTLEDTDDQPVVILEGSGRTTPSISPSITPLATPASETTLGATSSDDAELKGKSKKREKEEKAAEWKEGIRNRWEGLRRSASSAVDTKKKGKGKAEEGDVKGKGKGKEKEKLEVKEEKSEEDELRRALDGLNLAAKGGRAFSISPETAQLLDRFTQILKDLVNGVPTAYNDLVELLESSSKTLEETFSSLPSFLQKIIKTLPEKMRDNMRPGLLRAVAATTPAAAAEIEKLSSIPTLKEMVTKPGLLMGILKSMINLLKTKFPMALGGANLAISMGLFRKFLIYSPLRFGGARADGSFIVVLIALWYCYKRGREVRLEKERLEAEALAAGEGAATGAAPTVVVQGESGAEK